MSLGALLGIPSLEAQTTSSIANRDERYKAVYARFVAVLSPTPFSGELSAIFADLKGVNIYATQYQRKHPPADTKLQRIVFAFGWLGQECEQSISIMAARMDSYPAKRRHHSALHLWERSDISPGKTVPQQPP
ncbi:hypothetical protein EDD85DRAFT_1026519 [Armillaria nabsnona]|nr:hypothetical protein EDD85DRAFT_1026519 [Armillaria nabsnona]